MFKFKLPNFKELISKKTEGNNKKNIENLIVFLVLLVITIIAINSIWGSKSTNDVNNVNDISGAELADNANQNIISNNSKDPEYDLESNLEDILSGISGVRKSKSFNYIFYVKWTCTYV